MHTFLFYYTITNNQINRSLIMKKIFIISLLFISVSFLAFGETENNSKPETLFAGSNIITADLTKVQAEGATAATNSILKIFFGVGFDLLFGAEQTKELSNIGTDPNVFKEETTTQKFYEIPFIGSTNFIAGTRLFELLDVFGRVGLTYGHVLKETSTAEYASLGILGISVDANARGNLYLTSGFGLYAHTGVGANFNLKKFIDVFSVNSSSSFSTRHSQKEQKVETQFFVNAGLGLTFRTGSKEGLNIGYNLRYYLSSIYNTDDYILEGSSGKRTTIRYGDNQLVHGISFEYLFFL